MTIYSVKKNISEIFGTFTKPSHGTIHPALKKMAENGFLNVQDSLSEGGKKSSYYSITEKGKKLFAELMLSDFSDNPSVSLNELYIKIAAMGALNRDNQLVLIENCTRFLELYIADTNRVIKDEYRGLDSFQNKIIEQTLKNASSMLKFLKELEV